ncbi:DUF2341 domain-containing protein, partial [Bacteroidota bacterium]
IDINVSGYYRIMFAYQTENNGTARGFIDDLCVQAPYAHHIDDDNNDLSANPLQIFQLDSTYISGDIFPSGETKIQYKVIDYYGNYTIAEFSINVSGGENIISGDAEVEENTIHLYTTTSGMSNYSWSISGGSKYNGNDQDSIYIIWNDPPSGSLTVEYDDGGDHVSSCPFSVNINEIDYGCFEYKRKLTINSSLVEDDLNSFPVLVYDTIPEFKHVTYGGHINHYNGYDISFSVDSNGTDILPHQLDYYNPSSGIYAVWVMFDTLDGDADTEFYMHYGNNNINRDISSDTIWSEDWVGVYHMGSDLKDYGRNNNTAINSGTEVTNGAIGLARDFERDENDNITITNASPFNFTTSMTITYWIYVESFPTAGGGTNDWMDIIIKGDNQNWRFVSNRNSENMYYAFNTGGEGYDTQSPASSFTEGNWYYVAGTWESQDDNTRSNNIKKLFINSNITTHDPDNTPLNSIDGIGVDIYDPTDPVIFGINNDAADTRSLDGILDEIRISNTYRSDAWLTTDYNTQNNAENFITFEEEKAGTVASSIGGQADIVEDDIFAREFVTGTLTDYIGSIQWQSSTDKATFTDVNEATDDNFSSKPLLEDTYFRALVSNRGCSKSSTIDSVNVIAGFITCEYNFRRELVIFPDSVSGTDNLENFPFLVEFNQDYMRDTSNGGDVMNSNGWDIIFADEDGITIIPHEVEYYDPIAGTYRTWVNIPELKATDTTYIYMYYGKEGVTEDPSTLSTWSSEYIGVWHLDNDYRDTTGTNHGTVTGSPSHTTGIVGNGIDFSGTGDYITIANESDFDIPTSGAISVSAWVRVDNWASGDQSLITKGTTAWELRRSTTTNNGAFLIDLADNYYLATGSDNITGWH